MILRNQETNLVIFHCQVINRWLLVWYPTPSLERQRIVDSALLAHNSSAVMMLFEPASSSQGPRHSGRGEDPSCSAVSALRCDICGMLPPDPEHGKLFESQCGCSSLVCDICLSTSTQQEVQRDDDDTSLGGCPSVHVCCPTCKCVLTVGRVLLCCMTLTSLTRLHNDCY